MSKALDLLERLMEKAPPFLGNPEYKQLKAEITRLEAKPEFRWVDETLYSKLTCNGVACGEVFVKSRQNWKVSVFAGNGIVLISDTSYDDRNAAKKVLISNINSIRSL